ncbi:MAG: hypothetical protein HYU54_08615, partial [Actinobacteria bacterium]|nr:hypothetical protein [Actinomycetota bacterium]
TIPSGGRTQDQGARSVRLEDVPEETGYEPVSPEEAAGLDLYQVVVPTTPEESAVKEVLITYAEGLSWLQLGEARGRTEDALYGPVGPQAQQIALPNGGVAYYEPATGERGRRLSIHAAGTDLYLETNLSRQDLVEVATSLPVVGLAIPEDWAVRSSADGETERVSLDAAAPELPFAVRVPKELPPGYALATAELIRVEGRVSLNVYFQQATTALGGGTIRLHLEEATDLPPASAAVQSAVAVRGLQGRWTPDRHQLEWVEDGVYYSIDAPGLDLGELLPVAASLGPVVEPSAGLPSPSVVSPAPGVDPEGVEP